MGQSENVGMAFIKLTDWSKRSQTAMQLIPGARKILKAVTVANIFVVNLPTIRGLSQSAARQCTDRPARGNRGRS